MSATEQQVTQLADNTNPNDQGSDPLAASSTVGPLDTDQSRTNAWEPPALFRSLTQQQREDAHKKFVEQHSNPTRTIWHGLYAGYSKVSTSKILENKSSVARDHLANERTFLAWVRTSLSLITVGVGVLHTDPTAHVHPAITQLFQLNSTQPNAHQIGRAFGATFVMFSIVFLYFANARYFHSQHAMIKGQFPASRGAVMFGSSLLFVALVAMFAIILAA